MSVGASKHRLPYTLASFVAVGAVLCLHCEYLFHPSILESVHWSGGKLVSYWTGNGRLGAGIL